MDLAQTLVDENPDSALRILRSVSASRHLRGEAEARFYMLLTEACYKADSLPLSDSLIRIAVDYYELHQDASNAAQARYLAGIVAYVNEKFESAIINQLEADKLASSSDNYKLLGLINRAIGDNFSQFRDISTALTYYKRAYGYFFKGNLTTYKNWSLIDIANRFDDLRMYDSTICYAQKAKKEALILNDSNLYYNALLRLGCAYIEQQRVDSAFHYFRLSDGFKGYISDQSMMRMGLTYYLAGDTIKAEECNGLLTELEPGVNAIIINKLLQEKRYKEGFELMVTTLDIMDSVRNTVWTRNDISTLDDYRKLEESRSKETIRAEKNKNTWIIIIFFLVIIIGLLVYKVRINYVRKELYKSVIEARDLKTEIEGLSADIRHYSDEIKDKDQKIDSLENNIEQIVNDRIDKKSKIQTSNAVLSEESKMEARKILASRFAIVNKLLSEYHQCKDTPIENLRLYRQVKDQLDVFIRDTQMISELEVLINNNLNNLISDFRNDFPKLNDKFIQMFILLVLNFNLNSIALLQNSSLQTIYSRKSKLKKNISFNCTPRRDEYLRFL